MYYMNIWSKLTILSSLPCNCAAKDSCCCWYWLALNCVSLNVFFSSWYMYPPYAIQTKIKTTNKVWPKCLLRREVNILELYTVLGTSTETILESSFVVDHFEDQKLARFCRELRQLRGSFSFIQLLYTLTWPFDCVHSWPHSLSWEYSSLKIQTFNF